MRATEFGFVVTEKLDVRSSTNRCWPCIIYAILFDDHQFGSGRASLVQWPWSKKPEPVRPPKAGGIRVPDKVLRIDFTKPHDFHFRFYCGVSKCSGAVG
jgi:hypothetical protein